MRIPRARRIIPNRPTARQWYRHWLTVRGGNIWRPDELTDLVFWTRAEGLARNAWNSEGFQLNNEANTSLNAQLFSGRGIEFVSANSDYIEIPEITLSGDLTLCFYFLEAPSNNASYFGKKGNSDVLFSYTPNDNRFNVRLGNITLLSSGVHDDSPALVTVTRKGSEVKFYINGTQLGSTLTDSNLDDVIIDGFNIFNTLYYTQKSNQYLICNSALTSSQIATLYNNPNQFIELSRQYNADRIYTLGEGTYTNNSPVIDYSGNNEHGTFKTSAAGAYDASVNDLPVGYQYGLSGLNEYGYKSGTGTISSSGTTVTGSGTSFTTELAVGDFILSNEELREIQSITSNTSLIISSAFSTALSGNSFNYLDQDDNSSAIDIIPLTPKGTTDLFGNAVQYPWVEGRLNGASGRGIGLELESALGNVKTLAFAIRVADASTDQTIFDLGTPANITLTSSAIACTAFSSIVVDGSGNSITDNTWHYVQLQNATNVNIDQSGRLIPDAFEGEIIPLIAYSEQLTSEQSDQLRNYVNSLI